MKRAPCRGVRVLSFIVRVNDAPVFFSTACVSDPGRRAEKMKSTWEKK